MCVCVCVCVCVRVCVNIYVCVGWESVSDRETGREVEEQKTTELDEDEGRLTR